MALSNMDWSRSIDVVEIGHDGDSTSGGVGVIYRFAAHVNDDWSSLQGVHGGMVAALAVESARHVLADIGVDDATTLRSATFGYVSGNRVGDLDIGVEVIRRGRSLVTVHIQTVQGDKVTTVGRLHFSAPWEGPVYSAAPKPPERPSTTVPMELEGMKIHLHNVETHLHPATMMFAGADKAEWVAWSRPLHGGDFDTSWLTMFGDYFPPAVFTYATEPQRAVTIEYSIQIHSAAGAWSLGDDGYLTSRVSAFHSHDGFAVEDGWIWLPDGMLLATVRQSRLAGG